MVRIKELAALTDTDRGVVPEPVVSILPAAVKVRSPKVVERVPVP